MNIKIGIYIYLLTIYDGNLRCYQNDFYPVDRIAVHKYIVVIKRRRFFSIANFVREFLNLKYTLTIYISSLKKLDSYLKLKLNKTKILLFFFSIFNLRKIYKTSFVCIYSEYLL